MLKKLMLISVLALTSHAFACGVVHSTDDSNFCDEFKSIAICNCELTLPTSMCLDINNIYNLMIARYGSVSNACQAQQQTSYQTCMDDWQCYRSGGTDSQGKQCSGTGRACQ